MGKCEERRVVEGDMKEVMWKDKESKDLGAKNGGHERQWVWENPLCVTHPLFSIIYWIIVMGP